MLQADNVLFDIESEKFVRIVAVSIFIGSPTQLLAASLPTSAYMTESYTKVFQLEQENR